MSCKFSSLCFSSKCLCTQSRLSLLFVCIPLPTANVRHISTKERAKSPQNFSPCPSRGADGCEPRDSVRFSFLFSRESNVSRKSAELTLIVWEMIRHGWGWGWGWDGGGEGCFFHQPGENHHHQKPVTPPTKTNGIIRRPPLRISRP